MSKYLFILSISLLFVSCADKPSKDDYDKLKVELAAYKKENELNKKIIEELKIPPQTRLIYANNLLENKNYPEAKLKYEEIIERFPNSMESKISQTALKEIDNLLEKEKLEQERLKTLGFKALKEVSKVKINDLLISFKNISFSKNYIHDRYDDEYHYREAERGNKFIVSSIVISSETKDPVLPPVYVYKISNGQLVYVETLDYEFSRWDDYGSYLGNSADFRNDFAHTKTIPFELGAQILESEIKNNPIFVVVGTSATFKRNYERFSNPPVSYNQTDFSHKSPLTIEDFDKSYTLVKIFNKNLL